jgi:hypothetical protein
VSQFVVECRKEWKRLGVPEAAANEMAADLEVDLAEAKADGASPEEVLGNGYFDAKSFAASWAVAKGVAAEAPHSPAMVQVRARTLTLAASALFSLVVMAVGLLLLVGRRASAVSVSAIGARPGFPRPGPGVFVHRFFSGPGIGVNPVGWVILLLGLLGLVVTLCMWRPWSSHADPPEADRFMGLPSYL